MNSEVAYDNNCLSRSGVINNYYNIIGIYYIYIKEIIRGEILKEGPSLCVQPKVSP